MRHHGIIFSLVTLSYPENYHWIGAPCRSYGSHKIASHMRNLGWDIEVIDFFDAFSSDELKEIIDSRVTKDTRFVGFSALFWTMDQSARRQSDLCKYVRKYYPWVSLVAGANKFQSVTNLESDYYVVGFGEYAMQHLCNYLAGYGPKPIIRETTPTPSQVESKVFLDKTYQVVLATEDYPAYPKANVQTSFEKRDFFEPEETITTELSRGCRFACPFCTYAPLGVKGDHSRCAEDFESELRENYDKWGITNYLLSDETINDYTEKLEKYAKVVQSLPFSPKFHGYMRADLLISRGEREWDACLNMNLVGHHYGIETFNHDVGKIIGKGMHPDRMKAGLIHIDDYFTKNTPHYHAVSHTLIAGLPNETLASLNDMSEWYCTKYPNRHVEMSRYIMQSDQENDVDPRANFEKQQDLYTWKPTPTDKMKQVFDPRYRAGQWLDGENNLNLEKIWVHPSKEYDELDMARYCITFKRKLMLARGLKRQHATTTIWGLPYVSVAKKNPKRVWSPSGLGSFGSGAKQKWFDLMSRYKNAKLGK